MTIFDLGLERCKTRRIDEVKRVWFRKGGAFAVMAIYVITGLAISGCTHSPQKSFDRERPEVRASPGENGKLKPGRVLSAGTVRPGRELGMANYSAAVIHLKQGWSNSQSLFTTETQRADEKPAFTAFSSVFDHASSSFHRVRALRKLGSKIQDYERIAKEVKHRVEKDEDHAASQTDKSDAYYIEQNKAEFCAIKHRYHTELIVAERDLRSVGKQIEKINRINKDKVNKNSKLEPAEAAGYNKCIEAIDKIEQTIAYNSIDDILQSFEDYDDYFFKFNLGYQFTTVNTVFSKGNPRVDFFLYHRYRHYQKADKKFGGVLDLHTSLAARLTGSDEVDTDLSTTSQNSGQNNQDPQNKVKLGVKKSVDYDINVFVPLCKTPTIRLDGRDRLYSLIGPLFVYGGKKVDDKSQIDQRLYGGLRLAISPETYTDVIYGKTESRASRRLEIRGQMPIYRKENGSQVLLGAIANLGVTDRGTDKGDTVTIYAVWNLDVKDFFGIFK